MQTDPLITHGPPKGDMLHAFAFVSHRPTASTDPAGLNEEPMRHASVCGGTIFVSRFRWATYAEAWLSHTETRPGVKPPDREVLQGKRQFSFSRVLIDIWGLDRMKKECCCDDLRWISVMLHREPPKPDGHNKGKTSYVDNAKKDDLYHPTSPQEHHAFQDDPSTDHSEFVSKTWETCLVCHRDAGPADYVLTCIQWSIEGGPDPGSRKMAIGQFGPASKKFIRTVRSDFPNANVHKGLSED